jgi:hypothetical protein
MPVAELVEKDMNQTIPHDIGAEDHKPRDYGPLQGAVVVVVGSALFIGLAFGAMVALTGPNGWATRAANTALSPTEGGGTVLASYAEAER